MRKFLVFGSPLIKQEEIDEVILSMKSGWLGTGHKVAKFDEIVAFAEVETLLTRP